MEPVFVQTRTISILWRRLDAPGHDAARLVAEGGAWWLSGAAVFACEAGACRLNYGVRCDAAWRTRWARVSGWIGNEAVELIVEADDARRWRINGETTRLLDNCVDVDLSFSPATNLLPIRRLALAPGQEGESCAAWVTFPRFTLERLPQRYRRLDETRYAYEATYNAFTAELRVNDAGFVTDYPGLWREEM